MNQILDIHCHIFPDKIAQKASDATGNYYGIRMSHDGSIKTLIQSQAQAGITKSVVCSAATKPDQVESINNFISQTIKDNSSFIGFGSLHPSMNHLEDEIKRMKLLGIKGIKLHPDFQDFSLTSLKAMEMFEIIDDQLPILIHMGDINTDKTTPEKLKTVISSFPRLKIIAAHLGGYSVWEEAVKTLADSPLKYDSSSSLPFLTPQRATEIIRIYGAENIFFGTDYPMWDASEELLRFDRLELDETERKLILWGNAKQFLEL